MQVEIEPLTTDKEEAGMMAAGLKLKNRGCTLQ
jgi:hypothetical protein